MALQFQELAHSSVIGEICPDIRLLIDLKISFPSGTIPPM